MKEALNLLRANIKMMIHKMNTVVNERLLIRSGLSPNGQLRIIINLGVSLQEGWFNVALTNEERLAGME